MKPITIVDWDTRYENNRTRDLKRMAWVPMPNRHDGDGYTTLLDHPNGAAHFGAWCALVQVASRCDERGTLLRHGAEPHDSGSLARMTRIPESVWLEVLPRLVSIGWINGYEIPQESAVSPHPAAMNGMERNGMERNGKKRRGRGDAGAAAIAAIVKTDPLYHRVEEAFKSKNDGKFSDYAKEGVCIHALLKKARVRHPEDPDSLLSAMLNAFWKLKQSDTSSKGFWRGQPFLPSSLSALWDRVLETMRNDEVDPEVMKIIQGGAA